MLRHFKGTRITYHGVSIATNAEFSPSQQLQCELCEGELADFFPNCLDFQSFPHQHVIPDSRNLFCEMLRTPNEEMKHGGTMTDQGQREPCRGKEDH